jgi:imidazolonepropionase-like amidohydrolase
VKAGVDWIKIGTVEDGKVADLVAVEGDPLEDVEAVGRVRE